MKYADEISAGAMIYMTKFQKNWFRHSTVDQGDTQTHKQQLNVKGLFYFSKLGKQATIMN
jgi:hypothetical protein